MPVIEAPTSTNNPVYTHEADLPGEHVSVAANELTAPTDVAIKATAKRSPTGRLAAILRNDLVRAQMQLSAGKSAEPGTQVQASTTFSDREGKPVDPRDRKDLTSEYQVLDQQGNVVSKATGTPQPDKPALAATLKLPDENGPVTIRNITGDSSQGPTFEAYEDQTIIVSKPLRLSAVPSPLVCSTKQGRFVGQLQIEILDADKTPTTFTAHLEGDPNYLSLIKAESKDQTLSLEFDAQRPGKYRGTLLIEGDAAVPVLPLRVAYEFIVMPPFLGLDLPSSHEVNLGTIPANTGKRRLASWTIRSFDTDRVPYDLSVSDLSDGKSSTIPLSADKAAVDPTKTEPATVGLTADIGNLPSGKYTGTAIFKPRAGNSGRQWEKKLVLVVTESISANPVEFGPVEVGQKVTASLTITNTGGVVRDITLIPPDLQAKGGDIVISMAERIAVLPPGKDTVVPITLVVSPLVESRGLLEGQIRLRRAAQQEILVPLRVEVVDEGKGLSSLLVSPEKIRLIAQPGEVLKFDVRVKLDSSTVRSDELTTQFGQFRDSQKGRIEVEAVLEWPDGKRIAANAPIRVTGSLIAPDKDGTYSAELTITSQNVGGKTIPVTVEVKKP